MKEAARPNPEGKTRFLHNLKQIDSWQKSFGLAFDEAEYLSSLIMETQHRFPSGHQVKVTDMHAVLEELLRTHGNEAEAAEVFGNMQSAVEKLSAQGVEVLEISPPPTIVSRDSDVADFVKRLQQSPPQRTDGETEEK